MQKGAYCQMLLSAVGASIFTIIAYTTFPMVDWLRRFINKRKNS
jgi:hypothetical protein